MDRTELVRQYLRHQDGGEVEALLALLTDDAVLVYPMGTSTGKAQIEQALRARPGAIKPAYGEIQIDGDKAGVRGTLPTGMPIAAVDIAFEFAGGLIQRVELRFS